MLACHRCCGSLRIVVNTEIGAAPALFIKPLKATFAVLARWIHDSADLNQLLRFARWETLLIKRLMRPINQALRHSFSEAAVEAHDLIAETLPVRGDQLNADGVIVNGKVTLFGIVDVLAYPGTDAFRRFVIRRGATVRYVTGFKPWLSVCSMRSNSTMAASIRICFKTRWTIA